MGMTKESYFCKQLTFFSKSFFRQILVEQVPPEKMKIDDKDGFFLNQMASYNVSTVQWKNESEHYLYFFKRIYDPEDAKPDT